MPKPRLSPNRIIAISIFAGVLLSLVFWLPGLLAIAILFPGEDSVHGIVVSALPLAFLINFFLYAGPCYLILRIFAERAVPSPKFKDPKLESGRPVRGIIYTDSEIEEFKRRGLM